MQHHLTKLPTSAYEINFICSKDEVKILNKLTSQVLSEYGETVEEQERLLKKIKSKVRLEGDYKRDDYHKILLPVRAFIVWMNNILEKDSPIHKIQFIGAIYSVDIQDLENEGKSITFKIDVCPEPQFKNDDWLSIKIEPVEPLTEEELQEEYDDEVQDICYNKNTYSETITKDCCEVDIHIRYFDKNENPTALKKFNCNKKFFQTNKDTEFEKYVSENFIGRKIEEEFELPYNELPQELKYNESEEVEAVTVLFYVAEIIEKHFELNEQTLAELDNLPESVKTMADFETLTKKSIQDKVFKKRVEKHLNTYLERVFDTSVDVVIPKTIIESQIDKRWNDLKKRFGDEFNEMIKEKSCFEKIQKELVKTTQTSLNKYFTRLIVCEYFGIDSENKELDHDQLLYQKLCEKL